MTDLEVFDKPFEKGNKMLSTSDVPGHCLLE